MKRILVIVDSYPNENNKYSNVFVHVRVKEYKKLFDVTVAGINKFLPLEFNYEGVDVKTFRDRPSLISFIDQTNPDILFIHFMKFWMVDRIIKRFKLPTIVWIHGYEIYGWYRRLFDVSISIDQLKTFLRSAIQTWYWRKVLRYSNLTGKVHFVFVSNWLKRVSEQDCGMKFQHSSIIPNPIDVDSFYFQEKPPEQRKKILMIRSFNSRKYANDIAVNGILELSKSPGFDDLQFVIYGDGKLFDSLTKKLHQFKNVTLNKTFIENKFIPDIQKDFGVFLCPTRQDTHGVSMCEAMSSGLVPVTCNNTAIPEFVSDHESGIFADNPKMVAKVILEIQNNPEMFKRISGKAAESIRQSCGKGVIIAKEVRLIQQILDDK